MNSSADGVSFRFYENPPSRIFRVVKPGVEDVAARKIREKIKKSKGKDPGIVKTVKIFTLFLDLSTDEIGRFASNGLKDEILHDIYIDVFPERKGGSFIVVSKLPGVTDDEGASAQRVLEDFLQIPVNHEQNIFTCDMYLFENSFENDQLHEIAVDLLGNRLVNHFETGSGLPRFDYSAKVKLKTDPVTLEIKLPDDETELFALSRDRLLSLNIPEMKAIRDYYLNPTVQNLRLRSGLTENPTECELEIIAQTWSEHCKHKEFAAEIRYKNKETGEEKTIDSLFSTYIKKSTATIKSRFSEPDNDWLIKVFSDNAGVVRIDENRLFVWKVETHNSPSALDPYGGALTGILGNNRDPMGTGRGGARLLFNTNVLCFGMPDYSGKLFPGQLHPKTVFQGVCHGIEDGGNKSGVPTINGSIVFDDRFSGKPLVYCGTGAILPAEYCSRSAWDKEIAPGDLIFTSGGRVGKDGIHGATFSSAEIDENSPLSAVQIGSPITQKLLSDFLETACREGLVKCVTDCGAGGLSSAVGELAQISDGALITLESVPLKYSGLKPWEIFLSESQERMILVIEPEKETEIMALAAQYEVEINQIGVFTSQGLLDIRYNDSKVALLSLDFLHHGVPRKVLNAEWTRPHLSAPEIPGDLNYKDILFKLLGSQNICSREPVIRRYDHEVKGRSVIKPLMGLTGNAPQDAAVMRIDFDSWVGIAVSNGICPKYGDIDAYQMSAGAFDEAIRQIISIGGRLPDLNDSTGNFWSVNDNFCVPDSVLDPLTNPDGGIKLAKLVQMNEALYDTAVFYNIPMTSGKDSMKNDFRWGDVRISVPPTILYSVAARIDDIRKCVTSEFKAEGDLVYLIGSTYDELGASEFLKLLKQLGNKVPVVRKEEAKRRYQTVSQAVSKSLIESCHDISDGGLAVALAESAFGGNLGLDADISLIAKSAGSTAAALFSESHSRFVVSIRYENRGAFEELFGKDCHFLGQVTSDRVLRVRENSGSCERILIEAKISDLSDKWRNALNFE
ncbi:MAG: phosphoribosylformylglycinamidine synthase [Candidatus Riflebacteria bacterium]|nr:phosphoribosylformylglycinamidine synthase [Candidatus Riflebacteria bacterium]